MIATIASPIHSTIERVASRFQHLGATSGELPDGWQLCSDIVADRVAVNGLIDTACEIYTMDDRQVAASFLVLGYFWHPMVTAVACYLLERRVPDLSPSSVGVHLRDGVAFTTPHCWSLPDDPDAGHPDVTVVEDLHALRVQIVEQLEDHAGPLFATLRSVAPYGMPAMRANYTDRLASAVLWLAEQMRAPDIARREVPAFVSLASQKSRSGVIEIEHEGRSGVFLRRGGCCLNYRLPEREKCDTCSLIPLDQRLIQLRRHLE